MKHYQWPYFICIVLGLWLLASPISMGYPSKFLSISDLVSGALIILLSAIALTRPLPWIKWIIASIGIWLTIAPLLFWAPDAASYANDTLIGTLIILCSIIIPSIFEDSPSRDLSGVPPEWSYNPSSWKQRTPIIGLAFLGFLMARYLSAFQLGHISTVWDPFFGKGTEKILTSDVSRWFPVSDAGLGAWSYLLDALSGAIGGVHRWRNMPWVVILFGVMIVPPGVTSITLIILQPLAVGAWCTLCLITAVIMLLMVPPAIDEVVATIQGLMAGKKKNHSLWHMFWHGIPYSVLKAGPSPKPDKNAFPVSLGICTLLGVWCMLSPAVFGAKGLASDANHFLGALIVTFAIIAMAQVARPVRFLNCLFGSILAISTWFLAAPGASYQWNSTILGVLLVFFSLPLGKITDSFGNYDRWVRWSPFPEGKKSGHYQHSWR